jgi:ATP-binding cassette subfamily B protein
MLMLLSLYGVIYFFSNKVNKKTQRSLMENSADLESQLVESINSIGTIKRFGMESFTNQRTESKFVNLIKSVYDSGTNGIWIGNSSSFITPLFAVNWLWTGTTFVLDKPLKAGGLLTFYVIMGYFKSPELAFIGMNKTSQNAIIAADRLVEIINIERE